MLSAWFSVVCNDKVEVGDDQETNLSAGDDREGRAIPKTYKDGEIDHKCPPANIEAPSKCSDDMSPPVRHP